MRKFLFTIIWLLALFPMELSSQTYSPDRINNQVADVYGPDGDVQVSYRHFSDGTKYSMKIVEGLELKYLGLAVFKKAGEKYSLESLAFSSGRFEAEGMENMPCYYLTDHLGSVRAMASVTAPDESMKSETVVWCLSDYFPFGLRWGDSVNTRSRYQFNGKENQSKYGVPYLDYGARMYDNYLCRWTACDPVVDYAYDGYSFCHGNPLNLIDPDGLSVYYVNGERNEILDDDETFSMNVSEYEYNRLCTLFDKNQMRYYSYKNSLSKNNGFTTARIDKRKNPNGPQGVILTYHSAGKESYLSYQAGGSWIDDASSISGTLLSLADNKDIFDAVNIGSNGKLYFPTADGGIFNGNKYVSVQSMSEQYAGVIAPAKLVGKILSSAPKAKRLLNVMSYEGKYGDNSRLLLFAMLNGTIMEAASKNVLSYAGAEIGSVVGPVGSLIGGVVLGTLGSSLCADITEKIILGEL